MAVQTRYDYKRGCGWRAQGGTYLMAAGPSVPCGRMPLELPVCPTCHSGLKPTRSWAWIEVPTMFLEAAPLTCDKGHCLACPLCPSHDIERVMLMWCGAEHYPTPQDWLEEAHAQGVSRRLPGKGIPKGLVLGETWVVLAHRAACMVQNMETGEFEPGAGIFTAFRPHAIEYVCTGEESDEELEALEKRGITPVWVERLEDDELPPEDADADIIVTDED